MTRFRLSTIAAAFVAVALSFTAALSQGMQSAYASVETPGLSAD